MAIKITIDLSDATFAELSAVIGYAHQLGADPDEKLSFDGSVLTIEFDGDLQPDDLYSSFSDGSFEDAVGAPDSEDDEDGPLYVNDILDADNSFDDERPHPGPHRRPRRDNPREPVNGIEIPREFVEDIGDAVNGFINEFIRPNRRRGPGGGYGSFGPFGPGRF